MGNTINVNYMSNITNQYAKAFSKKVTSDASRSGSMADAIKKVSSEPSTEKVDNIAETMDTKPISKEDMTLEEYKEYISDIISSYSLHPTQAKEVYAVNISDAGFEAMKSDPEYEKWVLDDLKTCFATPVPAWYQAMGGPSRYTIFNYGATKEEFKGQSFPISGNDSPKIANSNTENSFWTNRMEKKKQIEAQIQKKAVAKKQQEKRIAEKEADERMRHQQYLQDFFNSRFFSKQQTVQSGMTSTASSYSSAVASYEASFMTMDSLT